MGAKATPPDAATLKLVMARASLPFVGFGIMDNAVMIIAGEQIDLTVGVMFGISTMAAAAIGNTISDVFGVMAGGWVETQAARVGIAAPQLTRAQMGMPEVKRAEMWGNTFGVVLGCVIGMFPLLFLESDKASELKRETKLERSKNQTFNEVRDSGSLSAHVCFALALTNRVLR
jgi:hypothetical protein